MDYRALLAWILCGAMIIPACMITGCTYNPQQNRTISPGDNVTGLGPGDPAKNMSGLTTRSRYLTTQDTAELHAENYSLLFSIRDITWDPAKKTVSFELTVKNVGNYPVEGIQKKMSELYAVDGSGTMYSIPKHLPLLNLEPGEIRSGRIVIPDVNADACQGLVFTYKFGSDVASWEIIPPGTQ